MERTNEESVLDVTPPKRSKRGGILSTILNAARRASETKRGGEASFYDIAVFALSLLFARCHIVFGAYPIAIAVIAVLPSRVWLAALGSVAGALTLGMPGVIYAIISVIVAFLRVIISATDKRIAESEGELFGENIILKLSSALIGGFIAAVYEVLLNSFSIEALLFGASMVLLPPTIAYALSGLFEAGISPKAIFFDTGEVFSRKSGDKSGASLLFFRISALLGIFLISISLGEYEILGVSFGFVFSALATLFAARRFGAITGAAVGFASSVGLSGLYSVAFALVGVSAGALSSLGILPAVLTAGAVLSLWGGYSDGVVGFLSLFPEYAIAAAIAVPLFKKIKAEPTKEEIVSTEVLAGEMVGAMALSYKNGYSGSLDRLESSLSSLSELALGLRSSDAEIRRDELMRLVTECIGRYFATEGAHVPGIEEAKAEFIDKREAVIPILRAGKRISKDDFGAPPHLSIMASGIADAVNRAVAIISEERFREKARDTSPEDYAYLSRLLSEARADDERERMPNAKLQKILSDLLTKEGLTPHSAEVFGIRGIHIILSFEDPDGTRISSPELRERIEAELGVSLSAPEYYRKGRMALMECHATERFSASSVSLGSALVNDISGDTSRSFRTEEGRYFALIADGMGSGEDAMTISRFVADYMARALEFGQGAPTSLRLLNGIAKRRRGECSASIDLFSFDLLTGDGVFYKCGAAPSYIKRGSSLFRIRSRTSPIGIAAELDAEQVRSHLEVGDIVIMFSDGVSEDGEAPWLLDVISRTDASSPRSLGEAILAAAKGAGATNDDLTVMITKIECAK